MSLPATPGGGAGGGGAGGVGSSGGGRAAGLSLTGIRVERGRRVILEVPGLAIAPGEVVGVVGPNGSGKSTLLKVLALVMPPDQGQVALDGAVVPWSRRESAQLTEARRRLTLVFQSPVLFARTVFDNVAAGLRFRGVDETEVRRRVVHWLARLGLADLARRRPGGLSGGEAQRAALARALVLEPDWLLLDEPTANLDFPTRSRLLSDLREILAEIKSGAVMVTHDIHEAPHFADRLVVMRQGRIVQQGRPREVLARPADLETAAFLGYDNILPAPPGSGPGRRWLCLRPEKVLALPAASAVPAASGPAEEGDAWESQAGEQPAGWTWIEASVVRAMPWGPAYRIVVDFPPARAGLLAGTSGAGPVLDASLAPGRRARLGWDAADGVVLGGDDPSGPAHPG